jgi:hypothetical protein
MVQYHAWALMAPNTAEWEVAALPLPLTESLSKAKVMARVIRAMSDVQAILVLHYCGNADASTGDWLLPQVNMTMSSLAQHMLAANLACCLKHASTMGGPAPMHCMNNAGC